MSGGVVEEQALLRVAVFGGSFNPPHLGHEDIVRTLLEGALADEVLVVPVFEHPFGKPLEAFDDRLEMARLAFAPLGTRVSISDIERELGGPSYTVRTLEEVRRKRPRSELLLPVGADALRDTEHWKRFDRVQDLARLIVVPRLGEPEGPDGGTHSFPAPRAVSSTEVRRRLRDGEDTAGMLSPAVQAYIRMRNLYRAIPEAPGPGSGGERR